MGRKATVAIRFYKSGEPNDLTSADRTSNQKVTKVYHKSGLCTLDRTAKWMLLFLIAKIFVETLPQIIIQIKFFWHSKDNDYLSIIVSSILFAYEVYSM